MNQVTAHVISQGQQAATVIQGSSSDVKHSTRHILKSIFH